MSYKKWFRWEWDSLSALTFETFLPEYIHPMLKHWAIIISEFDYFSGLPYFGEKKDVEMFSYHTH